MGDKLITYEGHICYVKQVRIDKLDKAVKVYNFEVEDYHTYFVSKSKILVHNSGCPGEDSPKKSVRDGATRAAEYSKNWSSGSLKEAVEKFAPNSNPILTEKGKMIYENNETGYHVVYDTKGNYFRIEDTSRPRGRNYLDLNGNDMNNKIVNGKAMGRGKKEYQMVTHFNNID